MTSTLTFDRETGELHGPAGSARLAPQPALALDTLLAADGELVSRQELTAAIWPGEKFGVSERLTYCIHQLRDALDGVGLGDAIETLPRRGYRLRQPTAPATATTRWMRTPWPAIAALLAVALLAGLAPRWAGASHEADHQAAHAEQHRAEADGD